MQTETVTQETTQLTTTRKPSGTSYTAVVDYFQPPLEQNMSEVFKCDPQFITAKNWREMTKLLEDPMVNNIYAIFKGKRLAFSQQRRIIALA